MTGRIVVLGATGHTGRLTAEQLVERGVRPVLAGRRRAALEDLAATLGGLEVAIADVARVETLHGLLQEGDVVINTVGPFLSSGGAVVQAAIDAGASYFDTTGESAWIMRVFEQFDAQARARGVALIPAFGYDFVPGASPPCRLSRASVAAPGLPERARARRGAGCRHA